MNNKDFITAVAARTGLTAKQSQTLTTSLINEMVTRLDDNTQLSVQGFGTFEVKKKMERVIVNPVTRQRKLVPPKLVPAFKPALTLKERMQ